MEAEENEDVWDMLFEGHFNSKLINESDNAKFSLSFFAAAVAESEDIWDFGSRNFDFDIEGCGNLVLIPFLSAAVEEKKEFWDGLLKETSLQICFSGLLFSVMIKVICFFVFLSDTSIHFFYI